MPPLQTSIQRKSFSGSNSSSATTSGLNYSASKVDQPFYKRIGWWCKFIAFLLFLAWIYACVENPGCPDYNITPEFQIEYFLGRWYEFYRSPDPQRDTGICVANDFLLRSDYLIRVENTYQEEGDDERYMTAGRARWPEPPKGVLEVKYEAFSPWETFAVLETDYSNYAVVYSCYTRFGAWTYDNMWVLTRHYAEPGTKLWRAYREVALGAIKRAFTDPEEQALRSDTDNYLTTT